jgi:putative ABC transport system ATP-binding protein
MSEVTKVYRLGSVRVDALRGVSFSIERGEYVAVMGPSGSGKSTLMNLLGCLDRPTTGRYLLDGVDVSLLADDALAHIRLRKLGFVFQGFNLLARTSALRNVGLPLFYAGLGRRERDARAAAQLAAVGLADRADHKPSELSGGQQQRVAIARALAGRPDVLLADEPTGQLDSETAKQIMRLLRVVVQSEGVTALVATHDPNLIDIADSVLILADGQIQAD